MIKIIGITVVVILSGYFLLPVFFNLCDDLGGVVGDMVDDLKEAFIETKNEWKEFFKGWFK